MLPPRDTLALRAACADALEASSRLTGLTLTLRRGNDGGNPGREYASDDDGVGG